MSGAEELRKLIREKRQAGQGERLRRALLALVVPATLGLGCTPLYAGPPVETPDSVDRTVDCDGDGVADAADEETCSTNF